jgi:bifunctional non-homologous end joining protein LigD
MSGAWALIRMRPRGKEKRENWLLVKERDEKADGSDPEEQATSVASGRSMQEIAEGSAVWHSKRSGRGPAKPKSSRKKSSRKRKGKPAASLPDFRPVQLATLVDAPPEGEGWLHELKYDGYRMLVAASGSAVRCYTRSGQDWTKKFPAVTKAFAALELDGALIDGEAGRLRERPHQLLRLAEGEG